MTSNCIDRKKQKQNSAVCHNRVSKYLNCDEYSVIRNELKDAGSVYELHNVKDVILKGIGDKNDTNALNEKYILRWQNNDKDSVLLIKESTKGSKVKAITEKISYETAQRVIELSTKWLCASISPLIRELGVKMTTERVRPQSVMSFERESFLVENRLRITADSAISLCDYNAVGELSQSSFIYEPVDNNICLLQVNFDRIIPEHISSLIGIKAN